MLIPIAPLVDHVEGIGQLRANPQMPESYVFNPIDDIDSLVVVSDTALDITGMQRLFAGLKRASQAQFESVDMGAHCVSPSSAYSENAVAVRFSVRAGPQPAEQDIVNPGDVSWESNLWVFAVCGRSSQASTRHRTHWTWSQAGESITALFASQDETRYAPTGDSARVGAIRAPCLYLRMVAGERFVALWADQDGLAASQRRAAPLRAAQRREQTGPTSPVRRKNTTPHCWQVH